MAMDEIELKDYRQPVVTSLGVILGFLLGFLGQWVTEDNFALTSLSDHLTFFGCVFGASFLLVALYRMLTPNAQRIGITRYYVRTLFIYMTGIVLPLICLLISAFL